MNDIFKITIVSIITTIILGYVILPILKNMKKEMCYGRTN